MAAGSQADGERSFRLEDEAEPWIVTLLALPELKLRVPWLREKWQSQEPAQWAPGVERLAERAQSADDRAREALLAVALTLVELRDTALLDKLRTEARLRALLNLDRLVREGPAEPLEAGVEGRIPVYRKGRELSLGERRSLARRPCRLELQKLLFDPDPLVLRQLFAAPGLTETDVMRVATERPARTLAIEVLAASLRWMARRRVRLSLILNPGCPHGIAIPLVSTCPREDLELIVSSPTSSPQLRGVAHELLERLPPLPHPEPSALQ